ncbi:MAG TPA: metal-dependent transcriptional regulator, partial [Candidatus Aphodovivens avicola]|nr:metal-dependent transcriptional regulator [Candidatus Aphodovivens avicola]
MNRNESSEDYLEAILRIRSERGSCRNVDIAERLGVSKASVTKALGNLA